MSSANWRERVEQAYRRQVHLPEAAGMRILERDEDFGLSPLELLATAAWKAGDAELHLLAWDFPPWRGTHVAEQQAALPLPVRLVRIPRELLETQPPRETPFVEAALLNASLAAHPDGTYDVRLEWFRPGLPVAAVSDEMRARAAEAAFDFLTSWGVDFSFQRGMPFRHHWGSYRAPHQRKLEIQSNARWRPGAQGTGTVGVKVVDVFGYETVTCLDLETSGRGEGGER